MKDFTLRTYRKLLDSLKRSGYTFQTFAGFLEEPAQRVIILRHDVEARYENALTFARIQHELGIRGTYYFRILPNHFDKEIIQKIAGMGHEIGYHYDDLSFCKGNYEKAIRRFEQNLAILRDIATVKTICMEGAPLSKWDNRELWGKGDMETKGNGDEETGEFKIQNSKFKIHYSAYGITGEPYFDLDFSKVLYLTDTGRRWDGKASVRDKIRSLTPLPPLQIGEGEGPGVGCEVKRTRDIIAAADAGLLPDQIMMTFHPQRWTDKPLPWLQELVMQNVKNVAKAVLMRRRA